MSFANSFWALQYPTRKWTLLELPLPRMSPYVLLCPGCSMEELWTHGNSSAVKMTEGLSGKYMEISLLGKSWYWRECFCDSAWLGIAKRRQWQWVLACKSKANSSHASHLLCESSTLVLRYRSVDKLWSKRRAGSLSAWCAGHGRVVW